MYETHHHGCLNKNAIQAGFEDIALSANKEFDRVQSIQARLTGFLALDIALLPEIVQPLVGAEIAATNDELKESERLFRAAICEFGEHEEALGPYSSYSPLSVASETGHTHGR